MRYQRTQVYLEPEDHARLIREAAERGISLAALMREIVAAHAREGAPTYQAKSMDAIIGIGAWSDDETRRRRMNPWDRELGDALWEEYVKETAWLRDAEDAADGGPT